MSLAFTLLLVVPALLIALPALIDLVAAIGGLLRKRDPAEPVSGQTQPLLFLIPAHDESLLITRCVTSLLGQAYPREKLAVVVLADHCTDDTAAQAAAAGAQVLNRDGETDRGKGYAIGWALERLPLGDFAAVVVVDADTIVEPDYASALMARAPLESRAMQTFDGASNEFETWLTRMAGLLTRNRYDIALALKARAGLSCPMTGDGIVLGTGLLAEHPWRVATITEGWELYARLTLAGRQIDYVPRARLYAQETHTMGASGSQRERWTAGRLAVLKLYWKEILTRRGLGMLQRMDLLAELTSLGPIVRGMIGGVGLAVTLLVRPPLVIPLAVLFATALLQPALYSIISLTRHPEPGRTIIAFLRLPLYAGWRVGIGIRALLNPGKGKWVRTHRRAEGPGNQQSDN